MNRFDWEGVFGDSVPDPNAESEHTPGLHNCMCAACEETYLSKKLGCPYCGSETGVIHPLSLTAPEEVLDLMRGIEDVRVLEVLQDALKFEIARRK